MPNNQNANAINQLIATDPEIQRVIASVWGTTPADQRPGDTPKHLEAANDRASKQIKAILERRGIKLPSHSFVNPRTNSLEGARGWAGMPTLAKIGLIGGAAAGGLGLAGALGALGGAGAAGSGAAASVPSIGVTSGLGATVPGTAIGGLMSGAGGAAGAAGAAGGAGLLASTPISGAAALPAAGGAGNLAGIGGAAASAGGGSFFDRIKGAGGDLLKRLTGGDALSALGQGLAGVSQSQASNRGVALDAAIQGDQSKLDFARERRADEGDIWKKMQQAEYIKNGGANYAPSMSVTGKPLGSFDFGVKPSTDTEKQMAGTLEQQLMQRLNNPAQPTDYSQFTKPSGSETALNWLSPALTAIGAAKGGQSYIPPANAGRK